MHDFTRSRQRADGMIRRWGHTKYPAMLRRTGLPDRPCLVGVTNFSPRERMGGMVNPEDRKVVMSGLTPSGALLDPGPDKERDRLVTFDQDTGAEIIPPWRIVVKPEEVASSGVLVMWILQVRS